MFFLYFLFEKPENESTIFIFYCLENPLIHGVLLFHQFENNYVFEIRLDYEHNDYVCLTPKLLNKTQPNQSNNLNIETQVGPGLAPGPSIFFHPGVEMLEIRIKMAATTTARPAPPAPRLYICTHWSFVSKLVSQLNINLFQNY